jgi:hypothetical protein
VGSLAMALEHQLVAIGMHQHLCSLIPTVSTLS